MRTTRPSKNFEAILGQRRAQINSKQPLPNLPGQALYLARNKMLSAYKDLTDALPSKIGGPNKYEIPPAYFNVATEPLLDEYRKLFDVMQAPPASAQKSDTPFKDVVDLGTAIARAKGLDAVNAEAAGRISLGLFFAETNGNQTIGNARSNKYKGSLQTGTSEDLNGRRKWAAIKIVDSSLRSRADPARRQGGGAGRQSGSSVQPLDLGANALMNAHAEVFPQVPAIVKTLPDPIDQMKLFELIQIIPAPTKSALRSGNLLNYRISDPEDHGLLAQQQRFHLWAGRQGQDIGKLPRNPRCDVAVQCQVRTGACQAQGDQGWAKDLKPDKRGLKLGRCDLATGNSWFILAVRCSLAYRS